MESGLLIREVSVESSLGTGKTLDVDSGGPFPRSDSRSARYSDVQSTPYMRSMERNGLGQYDAELEWRGCS